MEFRILGSLEVCIANKPVPLPGPKARALLAILLLHRNELVPSERLLGEIWGAEWPETADNAIHVYVSQLRKALEAAGPSGEVLRTGRRGYTLTVEPEVLDAERFEMLAALGGEALASGEAAAAAGVFEDALSLWRGPALVDFRSYSFAKGEIVRLEESRLGVLESSIDAALALGRHMECLGDLEQLVDEHPLRERLHAQLLLGLYRSGRQADALEAYRRVRSRLVDEAGIEPGPELRRLHHRILDQDPRLDAPMHSPRPTGRHGHWMPAKPEPVRTPMRLPPARTSFVGRRDEVLELSAALRDPDVRLLVLTGPGGVGKTRLALEAASAAAPSYPDGTVFVELAPIRDPDFVLPAIAAAVGLKEASGRSLDRTLAAWLADRRVLLVLDSFERVIDALADVVALLEGTTSVTCLITSRIVPGASPVVVHEVEPLTLPAAGSPLEPEAAVSSDAIALFLARARSVRPEFAPDQATIEVVARCCRRLDGLPLAIELAAARLRLLSAEALVERLGHCLDVLSGGRRGVPQRQRTLRATIDWSYELLSAEEQRIFERLAAFSGGFRVADVEAVSANPGSDLLDALTALLDAHLIYERAAGGEPRFAMLETIHQYAAEKLVRGGNDRSVRNRHAAHFAAVSETILPARVLGASRLDEGVWLDRVEEEHDNLRGALEWVVASGDHELGLRLVSELSVFWRLRGYLSEGRRWLEDVLGCTPADTPARIPALKGLSAIARMQGDWVGAESGAKELLQLSEAVSDKKGIAHALNTLASAAATAGNTRRARRLYERAVSLNIEIGDRWNAAGTRLNMGYLAILDGELERAEALLGHSQQVFDEVSSNYGPSLAQQNLGLLELARGRYDEAAALFTRSATLSAAVDFSSALADSLVGLAAVARASGECEEAGRIIGAAEQLWERTVGVPGETGPIEKRIYFDLVVALEGELGSSAFRRAREEGRSIPIEEVIGGTSRSLSGATATDR